MFQNKTVIVYTVAVLILLSIIVFLSVGWVNTVIELRKQTQLAKVQQINLKIVDFLKFFVSSVLKSDEEITFEERLQLENAVLDLKDQEVLEQWHRFTASKADKEAQDATVKLLELLANKLK